MNEDVRKLRIASSMSLEQAMLEVRKYLAARTSSASDQVETRSTKVRSAQFNTQAAMANRLSEIAARLGEVEPNSKLGALGVLLKRVVRKAIGWYSRPAHEFDRAAIELLQQIRQDMIGLQLHIATIQEQVTDGSITAAPATFELQAPPIQSRSRESEQREALSLMIELFKNVTAVQAFRQTLRNEDPKLLLQVESLLDKMEAGSQELKAALRRSVESGMQ
jgi:hypothetical protein